MWRDGSCTVIQRAPQDDLSQAEDSVMNGISMDGDPTK